MDAGNRYGSAESLTCSWLRVGSRWVDVGVKSVHARAFTAPEVLVYTIFDLS